MSEAAPAPPPPPPPPPPPGWKPNWREERDKKDPPKTQPIKIPNAGPASPRTAGSAPQSPHQGSGPDGSFTQYDRLPEKLQSTLSKDKKPFTYTPAGIDLSEIKSPRFQKKVNKAKTEAEYSTVCGPGSPELNEYGQQQPLWPDDIQDINEYCNNPAELDESMTNPRYTGSKIPSRSFRVLQALTATSDDEENSTPAFSPRASSNYGTLPRNYRMPQAPTVAPSTPKAAPSTPSKSLLDFAPPPPISNYSSDIPVPPAVPPPPAFYEPPTTSLYSRPIPIYKKVPPPVPPKPQRGIFREEISSANSQYSPMPPMPPPAPAPLSPAQMSQQIPPAIPPRPLPTSEWPPMQKSPFSESFYQSTVKPVLRSYNPPPTTRQTVRSGPGFNETTTERSGPGFQETSIYSTYTSPSYMDGTRTLPLRRETRQSNSKTSYQSKPYYQSPYQSVLDTPQFQDPFNYGMTPSYTNRHIDQFRYERQPSSGDQFNSLKRPLHSAPIRNEPFFQSPPQNPARNSIHRESTNPATKAERPNSMTTRFFDEINQMFDQTSANISREMYGTDF